MKGIFGKSGSSNSETNHSSIKKNVLKSTEGMYDVIQELVLRQKNLMMFNCECIVKRISIFKSYKSWIHKYGEGYEFVLV